MKKPEIRILGYYKREEDGTEYVHYSINGRERLTNGIFNWDSPRILGRIGELEKVEAIDTDRMLERLTQSMPFGLLTQFLREIVKGGGQSGVEN